MNVQHVRIIDIFLFTPLLFWIASNKNLPQLHRNILIVLALATLVYNAKNYIEEDQKMSYNT